MQNELLPPIDRLKMNNPENMAKMIKMIQNTNIILNMATAIIY